ncbi:M48 family metalloprotease [Haliea sp. E17]|uniref:M48 family metalloprotease n=1 Tax=Haliea sp. E17 TaxID=3401576 RepID=UPI003AAE014D
MLYSSTATPTGWRRLLPALLAATLSTPVAAGTATDGLKLPNLGDASTSMFSGEFEHQIGRIWLRSFRSQVHTIDDPLLYEYLNNLIYQLATHSQLQDRRLELVIVDNPTINAFAVPGGVIGVHNGLLLYAQSEDELATVLAHELAHLSQRHFSRGVEYQQNQMPINLAALLAGLVVMATAGGEAGMAAINASQALAQNNALRFSRQNEQEADRIGMQTLVDAGMDPYAAPAMFERMLQSSRYTSAERIPEFLRSHPLSENRVADTQNRARQYPRQIHPDNLEFQLMRARVVNQLSNTPEEAVQYFRGALQGSPRSPQAARYGLVLALIDAGRADEAALELDSIWSGDPDRLEYIIAGSEIDLQSGNPQKAVDALRQQLALNPGNHPLTMQYARALTRNQQPHIAEEVLVEQSKLRPNDPGLWYELAEVQGLSGNIIGLHQARAEYFILNGYLDQAQQQLEYAQKLVKNDYPTSARINQRLADVAKMREEMERL